MGMKEVDVSVLLPTRNEERYIAACLDRRDGMTQDALRGTRGGRID